MSQDEMRLGKDWIVNKLREIGARSGVEVDETNWGEGPDDFRSGTLSLAYYVDGKRYIERFSDESIEDCPNDSGVRTRLEQRLTKLIQDAGKAGS